MGSRPKAANCCLTEPLTELQVQHTPNLKLWLGKRNLSCGFFSSLIRGLVPPKAVPTSVNADTDKKANDNEFVVANSAAVEGPPNVPQQVVNETMAKTNAMVARLMKCTSPEDPAIQHVITSKDDLELAIFMSKALSKAIERHASPQNSGANENWNSVELSAQRPPRPIAPPSRSARESVTPPQLPTQFQPQPHQNNVPINITTSNFQQRGLTGLREPLLNYEPRQRRRSGEHFNNSWVEPPFKLCKAASSNHFR